LSSRFWSAEAKPVAQRIYKGAKILAKTRAAYDAYKDVKAGARRAARSLSSARMGVKRTASGVRKGIRQFGHALARDVGLRRPYAGGRAKSGPMTRGGGFLKITPSKPYSVAKKSKKFRKAKKVTKAKGVFAKRHFDDYGTITRNHALYVGFQSHGSYNRVWDILGEAVTKQILAKMKVYPRSYAETMGDTTQFNRLKLTFKRVSAYGIDEEAANTIFFGPTTTFEVLATAVADQMQAHATADGTVAPNSDTVARYLHEAVAYNDASADYSRLVIKDIGDSMINLMVNQKIRLQNISLNDSGTKDLDVVGINPLSGRKYVFTNQAAKLIDTMQKTHTALDFLAQGRGTGGFNDGVIPGNHPADGDSVFANIPPANQLFTNCKATAPISMAAGGMKHETTSFKMSGKLSTLVERIYYAGFDKGSWGGLTWFGFVRNYRQGSGATADQLSVGFNRDVHMMASCKFKVQKSMLKHYDNTDMGVV
jgi:hypothetical protein